LAERMSLPRLERRRIDYQRCFLDCVDFLLDLSRRLLSLRGLVNVNILNVDVDVKKRRKLQSRKFNFRDVDSDYF